MTFARHWWFCVKSVARFCYGLSFRVKLVVVFIVATLCVGNGSGRLSILVQHNLKVFLLTVLQIITPIVYLCCRLVFGLLYPAYASYKAVKTKNVKEYVKWMMYWIVFALFCAVETFADVFLSWCPFYYEIKMIFVFWLLSPVTKGSSFIYRKFVHPQLAKREKEIDEAISQAKTKGYSTLMTLGHKGLTYATNVVVTTAMKGQTTLVEHVRKSYSTNDLRVRERQDDVDGGIIDDSDDEYALVAEEIKEHIPAKPERLQADNRELERREKRDQEKTTHRRTLVRSKSDTSDFRRQSQKERKSVSGLSKLEEVEHEHSLAQENDKSDNEEWTETVEEIIYYSPRKGGHYTSKEVKADPYATLPRTRSRNRTRLNQV